MGREGGEEKGRKGIGREGGGEEKGRRGIGREGGRKDSVPVQNKQKTKQNKSNNPQAHGMSAWSRKKAGCKIRWIDWEL